ncbi:deoxyribodipyrimidine photo-lyase [Myriangium duriaei CBS 260.36]|uniref:Deoxyribodipyrimidine photo-lyase n=1 Tax=Myriangium duriaei CBS 260.36 TaxID=1168546 RepID=A0A9P4MEW3_9PEZI|nr:deoxyribodipyrimidine photo-lyase [Myriangium duriaei CBS 260.36]
MTKKHPRSPSPDNALRHPSTKRAKEIDAESPLSQLYEAMDAQNHDHSPRNVLHWFRSKDLRIEDNRGLHAASQKAGEGKGSLLTMYLFSPEDMEWHGTSPARVDFILETLKLMQQQLAEKNIPLAIVTAEQRSDKVAKVQEFIKNHDISHVYGNYEYEVDELRRDLKLAHQLAEDKEGQTTLQLCHDQTVVEPGTLTTGSGGPHKVFTPYHKAWLAEVGSDPSYLETVAAPEPNDSSAKKEFKTLFDSSIPSVPESKEFPSDDDRKRIRDLWPAGNAAGMQRLREFLNEKVEDYASTRSNPAADTSSRLSAYFSSGAVSVRQVLSTVSPKADFSSAGISAWVREVVFREFYRHMLVVAPHNSLNLPQNLKFDFVQWEDDEEGWRKWCEGKTGVPFVDAGMRQLEAEAWMHNRLRMNTASYLRANLLIDYRKGERWFAEKLVDWDLANNTQGWEPGYTVFNPVTQAEKNDPKGEYIRRWVPELREVEGKAVFDPYHRLSKEEFEKLGYPEPHVDFDETKRRCMERYKGDMKDADP